MIAVQPIPERLRRWSSTQLEAGSLLVESTIHRLDGLRVEELTINLTSLHRISAPSDSVCLLGSSTRSSAQFVHGYELTTDRCIVLDAGAEIELIAHGRSSCVLISLSAEPMRRATLAWTPGSISLQPGVRLIKRSMNECLGLDILQAAADRTAEAMASSASHDERARRRLAVERAREYIREHLADPMRLADLCARAYLQARSLEYGFRELVRLSPMGYVRVLRLGKVRRQLLEDAAAERSISEIALDAGFSHLSQFAADYKKMFGESPSGTRARALRRVLETRPWRREREAGEPAASHAMPWVLRESCDRMVGAQLCCE